jgi:hypothetical protein
MYLLKIKRKPLKSGMHKKCAEPVLRGKFKAYYIFAATS